MAQPLAIIIGAGPAGLTAAHELLHKTDIKPIIYEASRDIGGISKTVNYKGNRIDIGGHRFFSKSDRVMQWWQAILPRQGAPARDDLPGDGPDHDGRESASLAPGGPDPETSDEVMLVRSRLSRIFFMRRFFNYPISLNLNTVGNLGLSRIVRIGLSYLRARLFPIRQEKSLEDFLINRFGRELYSTFFEDYTEKVWGVPCRRIKPEWGAQRIKGLSITKALVHAARSFLRKDVSIDQKSTETSLINRFLYPKFGPGQLWEEVARIIRAKGGEIHLGQRVTGLQCREGRIVEAEITDTSTGRTRSQPGDYFFSTMPVRDLIAAMNGDAPTDVREVARGLVYRDFMTVGVLLRKLRIRRNARRSTGSSPTIGSTSRNRTSASGGSRYSTTGAPTWWPTRIPFGSGWSTSATPAMISGPSPTRRSPVSPSTSLSRSTSSTSRTCWIRWSSECRTPTRRTWAPTIGST